MFKTIKKLLCSRGLIAKKLSNTYNHVEFDTKLGGFEVRVKNILWLECFMLVKGRDAQTFLANKSGLFRFF